LMVGRTPEFLGKKIEAREMKLAMLAVLILTLAILGFTSLLLDAGPKPEHLGWLRTIETNGEALKQVIEDVLDFSRIEAGRIQLSDDRFRLRELVQEVLQSAKPAASGKGLTLSSLFSTDVPEIVGSDQLRLRQILTNLVTNAVKFTASGGVQLFIDGVGESVPGAATRMLRCRVCDTGIGIPPERRDRMFKPFSQVDASITRKYGGTGLGLAICARLVEALGGQIDYQPRPSGGTEFWFTFRTPVIATAAGTPSAPPMAVHAPRPDSSDRRVLVVEDKVANQLLMRHILQLQNCIPDFAANGLEGVELARQHDYDVIFMDLEMPVMNGLEATRIIRRETGARPRPRIVAVSASAIIENQGQCLAAGIDRIIPKPVSVDAVLAELSAEIGNSPI